MSKRALDGEVHTEEDRSAKRREVEETKAGTCAEHVVVPADAPKEELLVALHDIATRLRILSVESTTKAGSGHPTSCSSMAELMAVLFFHPTVGMKFYPEQPRDLRNDRFVLSKGHAAPILYAAWCEAGVVRREDVLRLRELDNDLEGHPTPRLPFVDIATGSLGQGLSAAAGMAYVSKKTDGRSNRFYALMGDGESSEGSVWEAMNFASIHHLDNLCAIFDVNRLGQSEPAPLGHDIDAYVRRCEAFGWHAIPVDGHNLEDVIRAFAEAAATKDRPTAIIAKTFKGHAFKGIEDELNWHGKPLGDKTGAVLESLKAQLSDAATGGKTLRVSHPPTSRDAEAPQSVGAATESLVLPVPAYKIGETVATRNAYGNALLQLGQIDQHNKVVALDADVKNSTMSLAFMKAFPTRFAECYIAEQNMVTAGFGMGALEKVPFCSTFGAFFARAADSIRMGGVSMGNLKLVGSHCGVSIGEDGPSQMALEDLAIFRTVPDSVVLYPSDAPSTHQAVELAANHRGIVYIRTSRPNFKVIYPNNVHCEIGKSIVVKSSQQDQLTIVAGGVTLHEALTAYEQLAKEGVFVRVIDMFSVKPVDATTIATALQETHQRLLVVEDHYKQGGMLEAIMGALPADAVRVAESLCPAGVPRSGKPQELLERFQIDSTAIVRAVKELAGK